MPNSHPCSSYLTSTQHNYIPSIMGIIAFYALLPLQTHRSYLLQYPHNLSLITLFSDFHHEVVAPDMDHLHQQPFLLTTLPTVLTIPPGIVGTMNPLVVMVQSASLLPSGLDLHSNIFDLPISLKRMIKLPHVDLTSLNSLILTHWN